MQKFLNRNEIETMDELLNVIRIIPQDEENNDRVLDHLETLFKYKLLTCRHDNFLEHKVKYIIRKVINGTLNCKYCEQKERYEEKLEIKIDHNNHTFTCLLCDLVYNREPSKFLYNVNHFKCYCKSKRSSEADFYKKLYLNVNNLYKSFSGYGTGLNHSSDFYIKTANGKIIIIHLDDVSHKIQLNRERDLYKLRLSERIDTFHNIFIHQKTFTANMDEVIEQVIDYVNQEDLPKNTWISNCPSFYEYQRDFLDYLVNEENDEE